MPESDDLHPESPTARFEFKYRIPESVVSNLSEIAQFHLQPDQHSSRGQYTVNSLYFDTADEQDAHDTDEGVVLRSKVRLRSYYASPRPPFFLELKQRFGSSIYKTRVALSPEDADRLANGRAPIDAYGTSSRNEALDTIREVIDRRGMTQRVWVKYQRVAWTSPWGDGVRMTLDRSLETQVAPTGSAMDLCPVGWMYPELDERPVLEFKFFGAAPAWMQRLARDFELDRTSCSKYGLCQGSTVGRIALPRLVETA